MKTSKILKKAKKIISNPVNWTKYRLAKTEDFVSVEPMSEDAFCFCSIGAVEKALDGEDYSPEYVNALNCLNLVVKQKNKKNCDTVSSFNDKSSTTHDDIMKLFDDAIDLAKGQEKYAKYLF